MIGSLFFILNRMAEIFFLIPIIGMLVRYFPHTRTCQSHMDLLNRFGITQAYFVNGFVKDNMITPAYILVLFIVSVVAVFWALDTLIRYSSTKRSAIFVAFVDLCFMGGFIAGVYELGFIANANCANWSGGIYWTSLGPFGEYGQRIDNNLHLEINKTCAMLKASFALGIMEIVFFFFTALLALFLHSRHQRDVVVKETVVRRRSHSSHHGRGRGHSASSHHTRHRSSSRRPSYV
ncbi:hypothetical protein N7495_006799 [Penicillium taxi]|uniref:uncharacterized protein n=1 Tax=Penicillium taxi TaxID=168475 RepID=UPI0025458DAB|nr:uncharacterized protein N7495_006799 [Penicillium taxi]KAJ5895108.1 hypothetical protein N7495_006799 [Penicillium taxi]